MVTETYLLHIFYKFWLAYLYKAVQSNLHTHINHAIILSNSVPLSHTVKHNNFKSMCLVTKGKLHHSCTEKSSKRTILRYAHIYNSVTLLTQKYWILISFVITFCWRKHHQKLKDNPQETYPPSTQTLDLYSAHCSNYQTQTRQNRQDKL